MSRIEWTDATWNPTVGCTRVSPGCEHCYAETVARRGMQEAHRGLTTVRGRWNGKVRLLPGRLEQPIRWRKPRHVFVDSMSDLFHPEVPDDFIDKVFGIMAFSPKHTFQVLTKRPERARDWFDVTANGCSREMHVFSEHERLWKRLGGSKMHAFRSWPGWPLPNVWLGASVEDQARADERIPHLLATPAAVRFLSVEPLLGPVDLTRVDGGALDSEASGIKLDALRGGRQSDTPWHIDWVIVGGESGPGARPCRVEWIRDVVRQCREAGVPVFCKQLGAHIIDRNDAGFDGCEPWEWPEDTRAEDLIRYRHWQGDPVRIRLRDRKGGDPAEWPEDLRVREWPEVRP